MILEFKDEFRFLSNFWICNVQVMDMLFPSSEHAFMSFKNDSLEWKQECQRFDITPGQIKRKARNIKLRPDWEEIKIQRMWLVVYEKFRQNLDIQQKLVDTGDQNLVEGNWWGDKVWGVCLKSNPNVGENHLGRILMDVRDRF